MEKGRDFAQRGFGAENALWRFRTTPSDGALIQTHGPHDEQKAELEPTLTEPRDAQPGAVVAPPT